MYKKDESKNKSDRGKAEDVNTERKGKNRKGVCPVADRCGGCQYQGVSYQEQLERKQTIVRKLLKPLAPVEAIQGMEEPLHYRNKVHAVFSFTRKHEIISGIYEENSHRVVPVKSCMIENEGADVIIQDIRAMLPSFKIKVYDEDTGYGLFRHVLIRTGHYTGQVLVVLVLASPILPSRGNFVKALVEKHPEITSIVINVNDKRTSMVLGDKETVIYGKGYIEDRIGDCIFRISPRSFYQVNPVQTQNLYAKALELAELTGKERVIDAYCGTGTIGILASEHAKEVIGVELNKDAVRDAITNAKVNGRKNIWFYQKDAGEFLVQMAEQGEKADVIIMDPPRAGSSEAFIKSIGILAPVRVVYVSCNPETLARDVRLLKKQGYMPEQFWPFDMFPYTEHVETVVRLIRR